MTFQLLREKRYIPVTGVAMPIALEEKVADKPAVVCPYVLVPASTDISNDVDDGACDETGGNDDVHPLLEKYLEKNDGSLKDCLILLEADGEGILNLP